METSRALIDEADFLPIPGGSAVLGLEMALAAELDAIVREGVDATPHGLYRVKPFEIMRTPVTRAMYARFDATAICGEPNDSPVTAITLAEARAFARACGARLPTELEWEFAARGKDGRRFPWGERALAKPPYPRPRRLSRDDYAKLPVGQRPDLVSPYGVEDMMGLIDEWTDTVWDRTWSIVKGSPVSMACLHVGRRFVLKQRDRWVCTGFRLVRPTARERA